MGGRLVGGCLEVGGGGRRAAGEGEQQQEDDEACVPGNIDHYEETRSLEMNVAPRKGISGVTTQNLPL